MAQTVPTSVSAASAGTTRATGHSSAKAIAAIEPAAAERARDAQAQCNVREQVERRADAETERRDRAELVVDVGERRLHPEREEDDPRDHRQMQVGVEVTSERNALRAATVGE